MLRESSASAGITTTASALIEETTSSIVWIVLRRVVGLLGLEGLMWGHRGGVFICLELAVIGLNF